MKLSGILSKEHSEENKVKWFKQRSTARHEKGVDSAKFSRSEAVS